MLFDRNALCVQGSVAFSMGYLLRLVATSGQSHAFINVLPINNNNNNSNK